MSNPLHADIEQLVADFVGRVRFRVTASSGFGHCYPPMHWGATPADALRAAIGEFESRRHLAVHRGDTK